MSYAYVLCAMSHMGLLKFVRTSNRVGLSPLFYAFLGVFSIEAEKNQQMSLTPRDGTSGKEPSTRKRPYFAFFSGAKR